MVQPETPDISDGVRIPAWKRIGLKLANESESKKRKSVDIGSTSPPTAETNGAVHDSISSFNKKRKRSNDETVSTPPSSLKSSHGPEMRRQSSIEPSPQVKRKKSVTFTPDTKKEDGDSAQKLYQEWSFSQMGGEEEFTPEEATEFQTTKSHPANAEAPLNPNQWPTIAQKEKKKNKKEKKVKESKSDKGEEAQPSEKAAGNDPSTTAPYVNYLVQFHAARDNWKFNKNLQTLLIKHAFDIPSEHHKAFLAYVCGLKGDSIRTFLQTAAAVAIKETDDLKISDMEDVNARTESRNRALKRQLQTTKLQLREAQDIAESKTPEFAAKLEKRKWAEHILNALRQVAQYESPAEEKPTGLPSFAGSRIVFDDTDGPPPKRKRMREKVRKTGLPDDDLVSISSVGSLSSDSTSSDESSDSDSGSDCTSEAADDCEADFGKASDHSEGQDSDSHSDSDSSSDSSDDSPDDEE
jgi:WKF domain